VNPRSRIAARLHGGLPSQQRSCGASCGRSGSKCDEKAPSVFRYLVLVADRFRCRHVDFGDRVQLGRVLVPMSDDAAKLWAAIAVAACCAIAGWVCGVVAASAAVLIGVCI
jgi:hypothetical protein